MSELKKVIVVSIEDEEIALKMQVASEDYSAIYDVVSYKQAYDKDEGKWKDDAEATERHEKNLELIGGMPSVDDEISLYVDEESGKAYFTEGSGYIRPEKPKVTLKRLKGVPIVAIQDSPKCRSVIVEHKGKYYAFNFNYGVWIESKGTFIMNKAKLIKQKARFEELFEEVELSWDDAIDVVAQRASAEKHFIIDCVVKKNQLEPESPFGWLEPQPLDGDEQPEFVPNLEPERDETEQSEDDLPF